jgi:hypothetical protein
MHVVCNAKIECSIDQIGGTYFVWHKSPIIIQDAPVTSGLFISGKLSEGHYGVTSPWDDSLFPRCRHKDVVSSQRCRVITKMLCYHKDLVPF